MKIISINSGLGNQMFQYAFYIFLKNEIKIKSKIMFRIDCHAHNGFELERIFSNIKIKRAPYLLKFIIKVYFLLDKISMRFLKKHLKLKWFFIVRDPKGYRIAYTNEKVYKESFYFLCLLFNIKYYYDNNKEIIFERFQFPVIKDKKNLEILNKIETTNSVSLHVRLGDHLQNIHAFNLSKSNYYDLAIQEIKSRVKNPHFFIFSDEVDKCRNFFKDLKDCYFIDWNKDKNSYRDMQLMSLCKHNIMANSSFSFWGAYLNKNKDKTVIGLKEYMPYPDEWIKITIPLAKDLL